MKNAIGLAALALVMWGVPAQASVGPINVCGFFNALSPATATKPAQLVIDGTIYTLTGPGTITPPDISTRVGLLTHPLVRLTGTVDGTTVTNYEMTQVLSCGGLPNTATLGERAGSQSTPWSVVVAMIALGLAAALALLLRQRRAR